jgi:ABC-type glycerol-3-phosphate transport system substrate-binding protein
MNRMALAVLPGLAALLLAGACTSPAKSAASTVTGAETAKLTVPVAVEAQLGDGQAKVTLRFEAPASNVKVHVYGVDGLVVKSAETLVDGASFVKDAVTTFDVAFTPGVGRSHLAVAVSGSFQGGARSSVSTFAVGEPSPGQQKGSGNVVTDEDGQRIKVMPTNGQ